MAKASTSAATSASRGLLVSDVFTEAEAEVLFAMQRAGGYGSIASLVRGALMRHAEQLEVEDAGVFELRVPRPAAKR